MDSEMAKKVQVASATKPDPENAKVTAKVWGDTPVECDVLYDVRTADGKELRILKVEQVASVEGGTVRTILTVDADKTSPVATFQTVVK